MIINQLYPCFREYSGFAKIEISNSVIYIEDEAFYGCNNLAKITSYAEDPPIYEDKTFTEYTAELYVPIESIDLYKTADVWQLFENILPINDLTK